MKSKTTQILLTAVMIGLQYAVAVSSNTIINPYENVNWDTFGRHRANLHSHTTESDGHHTPSELIYDYYDRGYTILSITDHDTAGWWADYPTPEPTWPWTDYEEDPDYPLDPDVLGMVAIEGNEISRPHHIGSYFNDYGDPDQTDAEQAIIEIGNRDGLAVMFHPGQYDWTVQQYLDLYHNYSHLVGIEVYNQGDRHPRDRKLWDDILTETMPDRPVWGYSNDDTHRDYHVARNWNVFLLEELSEAAVSEAMENGQFYFCYSPEQDGSVPVIDAINIQDDRTIAIDASDYDSIDWIANGQQVGAGPVFDRYALADNVNYIRARLTGEQGYSYTQPFGLMPTDLYLSKLPDSVRVEPGAEVKFSVGVDDAYSQVTYQWYKSEDNVPEPSVDQLLYSENESLLSFTDVGTDDEGYYYCHVTITDNDQDIVILTPAASLRIRRPVAHWPLCQSHFVDDQYQDISGNQRHADPDIPPEDMAFVPGANPDVTGQGLDLASFPGAAARAGTQSPAALTAEMTLSVWVKWAGANGEHQGIISKRDYYDGSQVADWWWQINPDGDLMNANSWAGESLETTPPVEDEWTHLAVTVGPEGAKLYHNGLKDSVQPDFVLGNTESQLLIGGLRVNDQGIIVNPFNGIIDDVRIYDYVLDHLEIAELYHAVTGDQLCLNPYGVDLQFDVAGGGVNGDLPNCRVGLEDLAFFIENWLTCGLYPDHYCP